MSSKESAVRAAARDLHAAIEAATAAGYRVEWPASAAGLPGIGISATAKVAEDKPAKPSATKAKAQPAEPDAGPAA